MTNVTRKHEAEPNISQSSDVIRVTTVSHEKQGYDRNGLYCCQQEFQQAEEMK
jgi:hypothetical protein